MSQELNKNTFIVSNDMYSLQYIIKNCYKLFNRVSCKQFNKQFFSNANQAEIKLVERIQVKSKQNQMEFDKFLIKRNIQ